MKRELNPIQIGVIIAIVLVLAIGIGYYATLGGQKTYADLPPANSRAEMLSHIHGSGPGGSAPSAPSAPSASNAVKSLKPGD